MFAIVNSKGEIGIDNWNGKELLFESKGAAASFLKLRPGDIELNGKPRVKELEEEEATE